MDIVPQFVKICKQAWHFATVFSQFAALSPHYATPEQPKAKNSRRFHERKRRL